MIATAGSFIQWLGEAHISVQRLTPEQRGLLQAAFAFRQRCGDDYYSNRLLSHFLLHCDSGLKVAQIARLLGISRPTASRQQGLSSKEAIQAAHHRLAGRPHGKLLPRYAGPIAEFILTHADATRYDILDFIERTWNVRVSTVALHHFCKKQRLRHHPQQVHALREAVHRLRPDQRPFRDRAGHAGQRELARPGGAAGAAGADAGSATQPARLVRCRSGQVGRGGACLVGPGRDIHDCLRACRYPHRMRVWQQLPREQFVSLQEPGVCVGAPPKEIRLAETETVLKDELPEQAVRTIVCREIRPGPKKDRWHPLYTTSTDELEAVLPIFRLRQDHEQGHRVEVHDLMVDAVPCGYDKQSPDRQRPRFQRGPLQMIGWLVALVHNAVADLAEALGPDHAGQHVRTLRRQFFNRPGQLYETPEALIVYLDRFAGQEELLPLIDALNAGAYRLPWLDNRRLVMSLTPPHQARAGP